MSDINIAHLAQLSSLTLTSEERQKIGSQMIETVEYISNLNELNTNDTLPTSSVTGTSNTYRDDDASQERRLPAGTYVVKRIL